jgi:hypothetical protein
LAAFIGDMKLGAISLASPDFDDLFKSGSLENFV